MSTEKAVGRAIAMMRSNLGDDLSLDDMARAAMFSKFHFTRVFHKVTGISPGRFLTALRIEEAKRLLRTTTRTVADIGTSVGYTSVSTFSGRFTRSVGLTPMTFRRCGEAPLSRASPSTHLSTISGYLSTLCTHDGGAVFVGLFPESIAEGLPESWTVASAPGPYWLDGVRPGTWHMVVHPVDSGRSTARHNCGARSGPLVLHHRPSLWTIDVTLRPLRTFDPPAMLSLPRSLGPVLPSTPQAA
ncbi:helix-turn-helix domain-containing protein [Actinoplanes sp. NPDC049599]|uniref:helix-turn-helix domain-containing protein n=1 Tax=Actinoplanes sp. NPDC049599 TaxID=3363903 RepID=UPI0037AECE78